MSLFRRFQAWLRRRVGYGKKRSDWVEGYNRQPAPVKDDLMDIS